LLYLMMEIRLMIFGPTLTNNPTLVRVHLK